MFGLVVYDCLLSQGKNCVFESFICIEIWLFYFSQSRTVMLRILRYEAGIVRLKFDLYLKSNDCIHNLPSVFLKIFIKPWCSVPVSIHAAQYFL